MFHPNLSFQNEETSRSWNREHNAAKQSQPRPSDVEDLENKNLVSKITIQICHHEIHLNIGGDGLYTFADRPRSPTCPAIRLCAKVRPIFEIQ